LRQQRFSDCGERGGKCANINVVAGNYSTAWEWVRESSGQWAAEVQKMITV
jgi:hypothetical protein